MHPSEYIPIGGMAGGVTNTVGNAVSWRKPVFRESANQQQNVMHQAQSGISQSKGQIRFFRAVSPSPSNNIVGPDGLIKRGGIHERQDDITIPLDDSPSNAVSPAAGRIGGFRGFHRPHSGANGISQSSSMHDEQKNINEPPSHELKLAKR